MSSFVAQPERYCRTWGRSWCRVRTWGKRASRSKLSWHYPDAEHACPTAFPTPKAEEATIWQCALDGGLWIYRWLRALPPFRPFLCSPRANIASCVYHLSYPPPLLATRAGFERHTYPEDQAATTSRISGECRSLADSHVYLVPVLLLSCV
jgi:hypothetical protein